MRRGQLRDYFAGVGVKRLTAVDAEPRRSNQHEVGTTRQMRAQFLGNEPHQQFRAIYVWLGNDQDGFTVESTATHYDVREHQPDRKPEWRLYYPSNPVTEAMCEHDTLFLAMTNNQLLYFVVVPQGSTSERQLSWLFDLHATGPLFVSREVDDDGPELDFAARFILDEIGIEFEEPDADRLDGVIEQFGVEFPTTLKLSGIARQTIPAVNVEDDPDSALVNWLSHEEALFRRLERRIVATRLHRGFHDENSGADVEEFMRYSLSIQNRRKSRMGHSLENHLQAVFRAHDVAFVRGAVTENNQRPDFLFPSLEAYRAAPDSGSNLLTMLGAKSTCKDRWRQILVEASKIPKKHLLTLEPGISVSQTNQMANSHVQLVVPQSIQESYTNDQRTWLWSLADFIRDVKARARK